MQKQEAPKVGVPIRRAFTPEIRSVNEAKRQITFQSSDESVDRYHDVIRCSGWDYQAYLRNPIVLWGHDSHSLPVGKCVNLTIETSPPALVQVVEFATHDFAQTVFDLYRGKFLSAVSVGFMPLSPPVPLSDLEGNFTGYEFSNQELLELSCVNIPANKNALARAIEKGFSAADLELVFSGAMEDPGEPVEPPEDETPGSVTDQVEELGEMLDECAAGVAEMQKALAVIQAQLEPGDVGNDAIKPPKQRHAAAPNESVSSILARVVESGKQLAAEKSPTEDEVEITTLEQLGDSDDDINSLEQLGEAIGAD
jgi:HK97 family phage prohead protease